MRTPVADRGPGRSLRLTLPFGAVLATIAVSAAVAALMDLGIFRQLRKRGIGLIAQLVITIGLSLRSTRASATVAGMFW